MGIVGVFAGVSWGIFRGVSTLLVRSCCSVRVGLIFFHVIPLCRNRDPQAGLIEAHLPSLRMTCAACVSLSDILRLATTCDAVRGP